MFRRTSEEETPVITVEMHRFKGMKFQIEEKKSQKVQDHIF